MEARIARVALLVATVASLGASYRTQNFIVNAPTPRLAETIGRSAETFRRDLAVEWLGRELPNWSSPCPITARVSPSLGAGGATSFVFQNGEVYGWRMTIQGSKVRILDSVLPHEITHTVFATHFRQPLPRWADEGACTTVEHAGERARHRKMLVSFLKTGRGIAFSRMFAMKEYPHDILPLYAQGFSAARFLIEQRGKREFLAFVADGLKDENWSRAAKAHYEYDSLASLQDQWLDWVRKGSPTLLPKPTDPTQNGELIAANNRRSPSGAYAVDTELADAGRRRRLEPNLIYRVDKDQSDRTRPRAEVAPASFTEATPATSAIVTSGNGWHAAGQQAPNSTRSIYDRPDARPTSYQAVRQQPPQRPKQTILR